MVSYFLILPAIAVLAIAIVLLCNWGIYNKTHGASHWEIFSLTNGGCLRFDAGASVFLAAPRQTGVRSKMRSLYEIVPGQY